MKKIRLGIFISFLLTFLSSTMFLIITKNSVHLYDYFWSNNFIGQNMQVWVLLSLILCLIGSITTITRLILNTFGISFLNTVITFVNLIIGCVLFFVMIIIFIGFVIANHAPGLADAFLWITLLLELFTSLSIMSLIKKELKV